MEITGVDAILINVSDLARSRPFYVDRLGMSLRHDFQDDHALLLGAGDTAVVLHAHGDFHGLVQPGPEDAGAMLLFLRVEDVDACIEELRAAGVQVAQEPADQPWGDRNASVLDPDGRAIFLVAPIEA